MTDIRHIINYICWRLSSEPDKLGATKLNKILWFIDTQAYLKLGSPISDAKYFKQPYGPVPENINDIITELCNAGILFTGKDRYYGFAKAHYSCLKKPETSIYTPEQIQLMNEVIDEIGANHTAVTISNLSHNRAWDIAAMGEEIPIYAILAQPDEITDDDREWADRELDKYLSKKKLFAVN
jgi:hypothetical protein